jgi:hypothetical protein
VLLVQDKGTTFNGCCNNEKKSSSGKNQNFIHNLYLLGKGTSINDVKAKGEGISRSFENSTKALLIKKSMMIGEGGVKNYRKLRDVIYGRIQSRVYKKFK